MREVNRIQERTKIARQVYKRADDVISEIEENINRGALIEIRRFNTRSPESQRDISDLKRRTEMCSATLIEMLGVKQKPGITALQEGLDRYWSSIQQDLRTASTEQSTERRLNNVESQPERILDLVERIDGLNEANLTSEEQQIETEQNKLRDFAIAMTIILLLLESSIAGFSTVYMARLDKISLIERKRTEKAERELRHLSNRLVRLQEEERKAISRELHDEVGQILTGLRMELGTLSNRETNEQFQERLDNAKRLVEGSLRSVRNLALLLRPSMLDDLGLEPAVHWQAKEFSRRYGIAVSVNVEGKLDDLSETLRLCVYRMIQEAMTNCGKHADARHVTIAIALSDSHLTASVRDDGRGFDALTRGQGLGLMGMTERVRALRGRLIVESQPGRGTSIMAELPTSIDQSDPSA